MRMGASDICTKFYFSLILFAAHQVYYCSGQNGQADVGSSIISTTITTARLTIPNHTSNENSSVTDGYNNATSQLEADDIEVTSSPEVTNADVTSQLDLTITGENPLPDTSTTTVTHEPKATKSSVSSPANDMTTNTMTISSPSGFTQSSSDMDTEASTDSYDTSISLKQTTSSLNLIETGQNESELEDMHEYSATTTTYTALPSSHVTPLITPANTSTTAFPYAPNDVTHAHDNDVTHAQNDDISKPNDVTQTHLNNTAADELADEMSKSGQPVVLSTDSSTDFDPTTGSAASATPDVMATVDITVVNATTEHIDHYLNQTTTLLSSGSTVATEQAVTGSSHSKVEDENRYYGDDSGTCT